MFCNNNKIELIRRLIIQFEITKQMTEISSIDIPVKKRRSKFDILPEDLMIKQPPIEISTMGFVNTSYSNPMALETNENSIVSFNKRKSKFDVLPNDIILNEEVDNYTENFLQSLQTSLINDNLNNVFNFIPVTDFDYKNRLEQAIIKSFEYIIKYIT